ncbi:MAG: preprotein translocase subunit SecE [Aureispira sp.]
MDYIKRSMKELTEEVTWPTWGELQKTTVVVIAGSVFLACLVALMDVIWVNVLGLLY